MLAPMTLRDEAEAQAQHPPAPKATTNAASASMNGTNGPALIGAATDPTADTRKVKYWITMSLPTFWTPPPVDAKPGEIYLYRPDFYQDQDGIERRITLWFNPQARTSLHDLIGENTSATKPNPSTSWKGPDQPAIPAETPSSSDNPFRSPLDDISRPTSEKITKNSSTKNPAQVPAGTNVPSANSP